MRTLLRGRRYRLRLSPVRRAVQAVVLSLCFVFFLPGLFGQGLDVWWRLLSAVGLVTSLLALRVVLGAAVVVRDEGLRLQRLWPITRNIPWYRILATDVIPGFWFLELELNSGERIELPAVEHLDDLYERIEAHRRDIDR
ncbi:MAG: PH domain-containing protein [Acidimicrobiales bacterium]